MKDARYFYRRWLIQAPLGLILVGAGASMIAWASVLKYDHSPLWEWVGAGTAALVVFNAGLCVFGDAILHRVRYETYTERKQE